MKTSTIILFAVSIFGWISCSHEPENQPEENLLKSAEFCLGDTIQLNYQVPLYDIQNDLYISFDTVLTECRCPEDCMCWWQGYVQVGLTFATKFQCYPFAIDSYFTPDTTIENFRFQLIDVTPYPITDNYIELNDYCILLVISNKGISNE